MSESNAQNALNQRFRGFYPVVIDVETAGFNAQTDALLEIAATTLKMDEDGWLQRDETQHFHIEPFAGALLHPEALAFTGIDPANPLRGAVSEYEALHAIFKQVRKGLKESGCNRAIIVAHNEQTAMLFCELVNRWKRLGGWPLALNDAEAESEASGESAAE